MEVEEQPQLMKVKRREDAKDEDDHETRKCER